MEETIVGSEALETVLTLVKDKIDGVDSSNLSKVDSSVVNSIFS